MEPTKAAIISSLGLNELIFKDLFERVEAKTGIWKQTFITHLRELEEDGFVKHEGKLYSLNIPKTQRLGFRQVSKELTDIDRKIDKISSSSYHVVRRSFRSLVALFMELYLPLVFDFTCRKRNLSKQNILLTKQNISRCESLIQKLIKNLDKKDPKITANLLDIIRVAYVEEEPDYSLIEIHD